MYMDHLKWNQFSWRIRAGCHNGFYLTPINSCIDLLVDLNLVRSDRKKVLFTHKYLSRTATNVVRYKVKSVNPSSFFSCCCTISDAGQPKPLKLKSQHVIITTWDKMHMFITWLPAWMLCKSVYLCRNLIVDISCNSSKQLRKKWGRELNTTISGSDFHRQSAT